jgi:hypothetical protein
MEKRSRRRTRKEITTEITHCVGTRERLAEFRCFDRINRTNRI